MITALGAYPTDSYYDPGRPRWLPYWLDTPTESAQKWGFYGGANVNRSYPDPPKPQAPGVPAGGYTGAVTDPGAVDAVVDASAVAYRSDVANMFSNVSAALDAADAEAARAATTRTVLLAAALGVAALIFMRR